MFRQIEKAVAKLKPETPAPTSKNAVVCPYCGQRAVLVKGDVIYPQRPDLHEFSYWHCAPCDAYVGCHKKQPNNKWGDGSAPLGRLANAELRRAKLVLHAAFDPIWKQGYMSRGEAYEWLSRQLHIARRDCHIGMFDVDLCKKGYAIATHYRERHLIGSTTS